MKIDVYCTECQKKYLIDPQHEGRKVKCKSCGASFVAQAVAELETADIFEADIPRAPALELPVTRSSVPTARSPESPANSPTSQSVPAHGEISFTLLSTSLLQDPKGVTLHGRLKLSHIAAMYPKRKTTTMPSFATGGCDAGYGVRQLHACK